MVLVPMEQDALKTSNSGLLRGLLVGQISGIIRGMERVVHKAKGFKEAEFVLKQLAQETGGRAFFPIQVSELSGIYGQISDELSSQYTIGYTSRNPRRDGAWRRIVVRVNRPSMNARTKQGYFAPTSH